MIYTIYKCPYRFVPVHAGAYWVTVSFLVFILEMRCFGLLLFMLSSSRKRFYKGETPLFYKKNEKERIVQNLTESPPEFTGTIRLLFNGIRGEGPSELPEVSLFNLSALSVEPLLTIPAPGVGVGALAGMKVSTL